MNANNRIGVCQLLPSRCFVSFYEDLELIKPGDTVLVWLREPQRGKYLVDAKVVFNGILNDEYPEESFKAINVNSAWIKKLSNCDLVECWPLIIDCKYVGFKSTEIRRSIASYVDILFKDDFTEKYSTEMVEYWNGTQITLR